MGKTWVAQQCLLVVRLSRNEVQHCLIFRQAALILTYLAGIAGHSW